MNAAGGFALLWALAAAACGGARKDADAPNGRAAAADAGEAVPQVEPCAVYLLAVRPVLGRIDAHLEAFLAAPGVDPAEALGGKLDREVAQLRLIATGAADLDGAHASVVAALAELAGAVRLLGEQDPRGERLMAALGRWDAALAGVRRICPEAE